MAISLDSIKTTRDTKPPRILLYGPHGVGKTTFCASAPNPVFIQTEDGEGSLEINTFTPDGVIKTYDEVMEALNALGESDHDFGSVVIDSADHLEPLVWQKVCDVHGWDSIESPGFGKGYVEADAYWRQLVTYLDALRNYKNMVVILTAHAEVKKFDSPQHDSFDRYDIKLHKRANGVLQELVDCILFANHKMHVVKEKQGFNKERGRGITTGERVLYTSETPAFIAKNRYSLPPEIALPKEGGWQVFAEALMACRQVKPQPQAAPPAQAQAETQEAAQEAAGPDEGDAVAAAG